MTPTPKKNIDPAEIRKFSAIAHYWWDPNGPVKTLHDINPLRVKFILIIFLYIKRKYWMSVVVAVYLQRP